MSDTDRHAIIERQVKRAVQEAIETIGYFSLPFRNPKYDLKSVVENDIDFILGAVIGIIIKNTAGYLIDRNIHLTPEEIDGMNVGVFSNAGILKDAIRKVLGT